MPEFVYFEPDADGHCACWAGLLLSRAMEDARFDSVRLVCRRDLVAKLPASFDARRLEITLIRADAHQPQQLWRRGLENWRTLRQLLSKPNTIGWLPFFDHALLGACLRPLIGDAVAGGVVFRAPNQHRTRTSPVRFLQRLRKRWMYRLASTSKRLALFSLDETACLDRNGLTYLPDPIPPTFQQYFVHRKPETASSHEHQARHQPARTDGRDVYLLFGALGRRKGVYELLSAVQRLDIRAQRRIAIRLVGRCLPAELSAIETAVHQARLAAPNAVVEWENRFLTESELVEEVARSTVVMATYRHHVGMSGVILCAAAAGKPVIAQHNQLLGYTVQRYRLGATVDDSSVDALTRAIAAPPPQINPADLQAFVEQHLGEQFADTILDTLIARHEAVSSTPTNRLASSQ